MDGRIHSECFNSFDGTLSKLRDQGVSQSCFSQDKQNRFFEMFLMKRYRGTGFLQTPWILCCCVCFSFDLKAGVSFTFTNCGQSGKNGPSGTQITAAYVGTALEGQVSTGWKAGYQRWIVPTTGLYWIEAKGARGREMYSAQKRRRWNYSPR